MFRRNLSTLVCFLVLFLTISNTYGNEELKSLELQMVSVLKDLRSAQDDASRRSSSEALLTLLREAVNTEGCFNYPFEEVKGMGILMSSDRKLKLFNWNVPLEDQTHEYHCLILHRPEKKSDLTNIYELHQTRPFFDASTSKYLSDDYWYGALYYDIITHEERNSTAYTLLGWIGKDQLTTMKVIDVLQFTKRGIRFGAPIFKSDKGTDKRFFMEYSNEVNVSLKYHSEDERIVFDHLSPRARGLEGNMAFYGPDFTYDAFVLEKGKWVYQRDVYITAGKSKDDRPFFNPGNR